MVDGGRVGVGESEAKIRFDHDGVGEKELEEGSDGSRCIFQWDVDRMKAERESKEKQTMNSFIEEMKKKNSAQEEVSNRMQILQNSANIVKAPLKKEENAKRIDLIGRFNEQNEKKDVEMTQDNEKSANQRPSIPILAQPRHTIQNVDAQNLNGKSNPSEKRTLLSAFQSNYQAAFLQPPHAQSERLANLQQVPTERNLAQPAKEQISSLNQNITPIFTQEPPKEKANLNHITASRETERIKNEIAALTKLAIPKKAETSENNESAISSNTTISSTEIRSNDSRPQNIEEKKDESIANRPTAPKATYSTKDLLENFCSCDYNPSLLSQVKQLSSTTPTQAPPSEAPKLNQDLTPVMEESKDQSGSQASPSYTDSLPEYECYYRTKAMSIIQVKANGDAAKVYSLTDLFLPKSVFTTDQVMYVIGGARDINANNPVKLCLEIDFKSGIVRPVEKAQMATARASFGCTISKDQAVIYVAGGNCKENDVIDKCEMYVRSKDQWFELPTMNIAKSSVGLCEFTSTNGTNWLYAMGGLQRTPTSKDAEILNEIERVELGKNLVNGWEILSLRLPEKLCDVGTFQISERQIMIYGGWNSLPSTNVHYFDPETERMIIKSATIDDEKLKLRDFFLVNGTVGKSKDNKMLISGHQHLHEYDPITKKFRVLGVE